MQENIFVEGYGCSFNLNETEKIKSFLKSNRKNLVLKPEQANLIIVHTCAVKEQTENRTINRLKKLSVIAKKNHSKLIVSGCLPEINKPIIEKEVKNAVIAGASLKSIAEKLSLPLTEFNPLLEEEKFNNMISIIGIERGCLSNCGFCAVSHARGKLKSFPITNLKKAFFNDLKKSKEFWITGQDIGCYGFDINSSLPELLKEFLKAKENFRLRLGMMNPQWFNLIKKELMDLMVSDERIYRFLHLPVQSGSNKVLKLMKRGYTIEKFNDLVSYAKKRIPGITIATDIIVGYPGETEEDFQKTVSLIKQIKFDVVNISRFGERPNIYANSLPEKINGLIKKKRSRILTKLCHEISFKRNKDLKGSKQLILVSEKGKNNSFVGRTNYYKPVVIKEDLLGKFVEVKITDAFPTYVKAVPVNS